MFLLPATGSSTASLISYKGLSAAGLAYGGLPEHCFIWNPFSCCQPLAAPLPP